MTAWAVDLIPTTVTPCRGGAYPLPDDRMIDTKRLDAVCTSSRFTKFLHRCVQGGSVSSLERTPGWWTGEQVQVIAWKRWKISVRGVQYNAAIYSWIA